MPDSPYKSRSTPRKAPRQARSLATVSAIVEAAARILEERGHEGFSTNAVAERAGVSVGSLYQYFPRKDAIYKRLITGMLEIWLAPLREMRDDGDPIPEIRSYLRRKLEMARDFPRESRLFANEILQGAPRIHDILEGELKTLVEEKAAILYGWMDEGKITRTDPYHLIFSIWATTQHYADFDVQVRAVLGTERGGEGRFEDAARYLENLFLNGLLPKKPATSSS